MKIACAKIIIFICIFAIACLSCQEKEPEKVITHSDSTCAQILGVEQIIHRDEPIDKTLNWIKSRFRLDTVTNEKDFEIRIFLEQNFGGIWYINYSLINNQWQGFHVRNQNKINQLVPLEGWEDFTESLQNHNVFNLLTHKEI